MSALIESNTQYAEVKVIHVDWDDFGDAPITSELGVQRQSTLVMFKEGKEVGRVVAQTSEEAIEELFKTAV